MDSVKGFYINLDKREDRRKMFEEEMVKMNLSIERFSAILHQAPSLGCALSHLSVLKLAKERNYENVFIFEDDFTFDISKEEFMSLLKKIPEDFDVVMLGYYIIESEPYNETFGKVKQATTTSGYIVNKKFYDTLINRIEEGARILEQKQNEFGAVAKYSVDQYWKKLQPDANWFYTLKRVGHQAAGFSDLTGKFEKYDY